MYRLFIACEKIYAEFEFRRKCRCRTGIIGKIELVVESNAKISDFRRNGRGYVQPVKFEREER